MRSQTGQCVCLTLGQRYRFAQGSATPVLGKPPRPDIIPTRFVQLLEDFLESIEPAEPRTGIGLRAQFSDPTARRRVVALHSDVRQQRRPTAGLVPVEPVEVLRGLQQPSQ